MSQYEEQWKAILDNNMFSKNATIYLAEGILEVKGVFYSGSYSKKSETAYGINRLVDEEYFQVSALYFSDIEDPSHALIGKGIEVEEKGRFRIYQISGKRNGMLTLQIQEVKEDGTET